MGNATAAAPVFCVTVTPDTVFLSGGPWTFSTTTASLLRAAASVVSSTGGAKVTGVMATNYTGGIREIFAEPITDDEDVSTPPLFSKLSHNLSLLIVVKRLGRWVAEPRNVKKIVPGELVVATPPVSPAIRAMSVKVRFPDLNTHSVVIARVTGVRDNDFARRPMSMVSFSGARGICCDGLMVYAG